MSDQYNKAIEAVEALLTQRHNDMVAMIRAIDFISTWDGFEYPLRFMTDEIQRPIDISDVSSIAIVELVENITFLQERYSARLDKLGKLTVPERIEKGIKLLKQLEIEKRELPLMSRVNLSLIRIKNKLIRLFGAL